MNTHTLELPGVALTRVGYVDVPIPAEAAGLKPGDFAEIGWRAPHWTDGEQLMAGAAAWFADCDGTRLVFDPMLAADDILRADLETELAQQTAVADVLTQSGFAPESVDFVVLSHLDGIGMASKRNADSSWSAFFPRARILVSDAELETLSADKTAGGAVAGEAFAALHAQNLVDTFEDGERIAPGVHAQITADHGPGHTVFHFGDPAKPAATFLGHLAVSPLHIATGVCTDLHVDAEAAFTTLSRLASDGRTLIGPLWPAPGCGRWKSGTFEAATS